MKFLLIPFQYNYPLTELSNCVKTWWHGVQDIHDTVFIHIIDTNVFHSVSYLNRPYGL